MEPRSPEDGVTSLVGLPSRDMACCRLFSWPQRWDGRNTAASRRWRRGSQRLAGQPLLLWRSSCAGSSAQESCTAPHDSLRVVCGRYRTAGIPAQNCSQAVQSFQMKVARNCSSATPSYITRCQQPQRPITALQPTAQPKPAFLRAVPSRAAKTALTQ